MVNWKYSGVSGSPDAGRSYESSGARSTTLAGPMREQRRLTTTLEAGRSHESNGARSATLEY
jgi:hypothetical protein